MWIRKKTHPKLKEWGHVFGLHRRMFGFFVNRNNYERFREEADTVVPHLGREERDIWAAHMAKTHPGFHGYAIPPKKNGSLWLGVLLFIIAALFFFLFLSSIAKGEPNSFHARYTAAQISELFPQLITPGTPFTFDSSNNLKVNCAVGCTGGSTVSISNFPATQTITGTIVGTGAPGLPSPGIISVQGESGGFPIPISGSIKQGQPNTMANAWPNLITDGQNGAVAVKPSGVSAVSSDPALTVTVSPNSPLPSGTNAIGSVTATAISTLPGQTGVVPIVVLQSVPPISDAQNPLIYRSSMRYYCYQNLAGCAPPVNGGKLQP